MSSTVQSVPRSPTKDLTAEARIRNSALELFGALGHEAVSVRAVAGDAGVSGGLVIHHFGSKAGLIAAVDDYLIERVSYLLEHFMSEPDAQAAQSFLVSVSEEPAIVAYLGRAMTQGGEAGAMLFDRLYDMTLQLLDRMTAAGAARPVDDREATAAWLLLSDLGTLVLRHHLHRVLGMDPYSTDGIRRMTAVEFDMMTNPLMTYDESGPH